MYSDREKMKEKYLLCFKQFRKLFQLFLFSSNFEHFFFVGNINTQQYNEQE